MRYFGSKSTVVRTLFDVVASRVSRGSICDPFGGIGTVGSFFKQRGFQVWTGDTLTVAHLFQRARIELGRLPRFENLSALHGLRNPQAIVRYLNSLRPIRHWVTRNYALERGFFTIGNATKIDAVAAQIQTWSSDGLLTANEHALLLASLIESADRVANTAGTYYAYLKGLHRKALSTFEFKWTLPSQGPRSYARLTDALDLTMSKSFDVLYLDPPYNTRRYSDYYHFPESLATGYTGPVRGKAGVPVRAPVPSRFCVAATALSALSQLVRAARCRLLVFHYSDTGLVPAAEIRRLLRVHGRVTELLLTAKGYSTTAIGKTEHRLYVVEYA